MSKRESSHMTHTLTLHYTSRLRAHTHTQVYTQVRCVWGGGGVKKCMNGTQKQGPMTSRGTQGGSPNLR